MTAPPRSSEVVVVATGKTAASWAESLRSLGFDAVACPFATHAPPLDVDAPSRALSRGDFDLVLATSSDAVSTLRPGQGAGLVAAAVGPATARALESVGFRVEVVGEGGAEDLARRLVEGGPPRRVIWLRGERAREEGAVLLEAAGWKVEGVEAYRVIARPEFAAEVSKRHPAAWVVGSPAAAEALTAALGGAEFPPKSDGPVVIAVGQTTASALRCAGRPEARAAPRPAAEGIAEALAESMRSTRSGPTSRRRP